MATQQATSVSLFWSLDNVFCFIVFLLPVFCRVPRIFTKQGRSDRRGWRGTKIQWPGRTDGRRPEDAEGQLTCVLLRVEERRKTQVETKSGAKEIIIVLGKEKWLRVLSAATAVVGQTESSL